MINIINNRTKNIIGILLKSLCFIIPLIIIFGTLPVFAAEQPVLSCSSTSGYQGDKVKIDITVDKPKDIAGMQFSIRYDKDMLSISDADVTAGTALGSWIFDANAEVPGVIEIACANSTGLKITDSAVICSLNFTINTSTQYGETPIAIDSASYPFTAKDESDQKIQVTFSNGKVNVLQSSGSRSSNTGNSGNQNTASAQIQPGIALVTAAADAAGKTTAAVTLAQVNGMLKEVAANGNTSGTIAEIKITTDLTAKQVELNIPGDAFKALADSTFNGVRVNTPIGEICFDKTAIAALDNVGEGDISISVSKVDTASLPMSVRNAVGSYPVFDFEVKSGGAAVSNFNGGSITIGIPYKPSPGEDTNAVIVYCIDSDGKLSIVNLSNINTANGVVTFATTHLTTYAIGYNAVNFIDTQNNWSKDNITYLAARNIIGGIGNGKFAPDSIITRAEFVKILAGILDVNAGSYSNPQFSDIPANAWYAPYIAWAATKGIVNGTGNGKFSPGDPVTRQEMAVIIVRFANAAKFTLPSVVCTSAFTDKGGIALWAASAVSEIQAAGIISGKPGNIFDPQAGATRAEAAKMLAIIMKSLAQ